jgi:hypothetical protein
MTDIRAQAAKAAQEAAKVAYAVLQTCDEDYRDGYLNGVTAGYLLGHAAGVEDGARGAFEWLWTHAAVALREPRTDEELNELCVDVARKRMLAALASGTGVAEEKGEEG